MNKKYKINYCILLILTTFIITLIYGKYNLINFDKNVVDEKGRSIHLMIKNDPYRYLSNGYKIKQEIKNDQSYFETGENNFTKYLYPRIIALYYFVFDYKLFENSDENKINIGIHSNFIFFQILFYYSSLLFFFLKLRKVIENKYLFFCLLFLCIEPTIVQYHASFWSESIFFSLQIFIFSLIMGNDQSNKTVLLIGILLSLLALQRSNGLYYIVPVTFYYYFQKNFNFLNKILFLIVGFSLLPLFVSFHNFKTYGKFFFIPLETKAVLHAYMLPNILTENEIKLEQEHVLKMIKNKNLSINLDEFSKIKYSRYAFRFCENRGKIQTQDFLEICDYLDKRSKEIILSKPIQSMIFISKKSLSFALLNPFHIYSDNKYLSGEKYYNSNLHQKLIPYRIFYTLIIYIICFIGLIELYKRREKKLLLYILISSIYFFIILSWHGNNRYFVPILIYLSVFFGFGSQKILDCFKKKN